MVFFQGDLDDAVVLRVSLLGHTLQVTVGCPTQTLEGSDKGGGDGGMRRQRVGWGRRKGRGGEGEDGWRRGWRGWIRGWRSRASEMNEGEREGVREEE